jgi:hypothetical protein
MSIIFLILNNCCMQQIVSVSHGNLVPPESAHIIRIHEVRDGPTVKVVLTHALIDKSSQAIRGSRSFGGAQHIASNPLVIAEVVSLIQFVASTKL